MKRLYYKRHNQRIKRYLIPIAEDEYFYLKSFVIEKKCSYADALFGVLCVADPNYIEFMLNYYGKNK